MKVLGLALVMIAGGGNALPGSMAQQSLAGHWEGAISIQGVQLGIQVDFKADQDNIQGTIDIPQQGAKGLALKNVLWKEPKVRFELPAGLTLAVFEGELKQDEISGSFTQGPASGTFSLKRGMAPKAALPAPAAEPIPYQQEEVRFANGSVSLAGTLTLPASAGPCPAVVMITGSGAQNRDEEILGFKPFRLIADHLTRNGIAVLRYDDRGVGGSTGSTSQSTTEDFAGDVLAAIQWLTARPDINPKRIGLCGHSEGGIVAPMVASRSQDVAFIVLMSTMGVTGERIMLSQAEAIGRAEGASGDDLKKEAVFQKRIFQVVREGKGWEELRAELLRDTLAQIEKMPPEQRRTIPDVNAYAEKAVETSLKMPESPWFRYFLDLDPVPYLQRVRCPVLALFGELDTQVPAAENRQAIVAALEKGGNHNYTAEVLPKTNHLYIAAVTGSPREYPALKKEFVPGFLDLLTRWIRAQTGLK
jgi:pimeloyl-ACP methyl ester carboxylesterase